MVDRRRGTRTQADAQVAEHQHRPWHARAGGQEHPHQRGDEHQHHHLGLEALPWVLSQIMHHAHRAQRRQAPALADPARLGLRGQARAVVDQHQRQQQRRATGVVRHRHRQRQPERHIADAQPHLHRQRQQHQPGQAPQTDSVQLPGQGQQHQRDQQRPQAVGDMDGGARLAVELSAQVVGADVLGEVKAVGKIRLGPPLAVTGRQVDAGHRGIVGAHPAAQGDLPDHQQQRQCRQAP
uniref:LigA n=1 Tax=Steinernema glaseri TaxID=37863 RepID=A0A1I8AST5_9BILA